MAKLSPPSAIEHIADAMGIDYRSHMVVGATLVLKPGQPPMLEIRYVINDKDVGALAEELRKYKLVPAEDEG